MDEEPKKVYAVYADDSGTLFGSPTLFGVFDSEEGARNVPRLGYGDNTIKEFVLNQVVSCPFTKVDP